MRSAPVLLALLAPHLVRAASWSFNDGQITVKGKGGSSGDVRAESITANKVLASNSLTLAPTDVLKISLTTRDGSTPRKPDQAFLQLQDANSGLEDAFPLSVKENGKGTVEISQKDIPDQLLTAHQPLRASIIIASFGSSTGYAQRAFDLEMTYDASTPAPSSTAPERYGKKPEIKHIFRQDAKSPPRIVSLAFTLAVLGTLPVLVAAWVLLGANLAQAGEAINNQPVAHALFFGSILAIEGVFVLYYTSWNLFQTLPAVAIVGAVAYISGSRALTEVQERRLAGRR